jgi:hypothetical protein
MGNGKLEFLANNNNVLNSDENSNGYVKTNGRAESTEEDLASRKSLIILLSIFIASLGAMFYIYKRFPELEE